MIPILYEHSEENFTSLGLGALNDAISCEVKTVLNGLFELEMKYPVSGLRYKDLQISNIIKAVSERNGSAQLFDIYAITKPMNGVVTVYASHVSGRKQFIPIMPCTASTLAEAFLVIASHTAEDNPFTFWTDKSVTANFKITTPASLGQVLGGMEGSILDVYRGEYEFDNFTIKFWNHRGADNGVTLRYGKNITDIQQEETIANTITGICPFWADMDGNTVTLPEEVIESANAANFPFKRTIVKDFSTSFDTAPTEAQLRSIAQAYVTNNNIGVPSVGIDVSYENLADYEEYKDVALLEQVRLGDTVHVFFEPLDITAEARVTETRYNVLLDKYKQIRIGSVKSNLSTTIKEIEDDTKQTIAETSSALEKAFADAIAAFIGADSGYIIFRRNEVTNEIYEILAMDTDDPATAVKIVRLNNAGIGVSSNGINGQYTAAITGDGIVATAITSGVLNAVLIKAGILKSQESENNPKFYANLDTGDISIAGDITANTGYIGGANGFVIEAKHLRSGTLNSTSSGAVALTTEDFTRSINGTSRTNLRFAIGSNFGVASDGTLYASNVNISGTITSNNATITGGVINLTATSSADNKFSLGFENNSWRYQIYINSAMIEATTVAKLVGATGTGTFGGGGMTQQNVWDSDGSGNMFGVSASQFYARTRANANASWIDRMILDIDSLAFYNASSVNTILLDQTGLLFYNASNVLTKAIYADTESNAHLLGSTASSSYTSVSITNMQMYRAFVLNACRGSGSGVMASTYIPYEQARLCTSTSVETWAMSAQNGIYFGKCYFDFINNRAYIVSSGNADCKVKIYGIT